MLLGLAVCITGDEETSKRVVNCCKSEKNIIRYLGQIVRPAIIHKRPVHRDVLDGCKFCRLTIRYRGENAYVARKPKLCRSLSLYKQDS